MNGNIDAQDFGFGFDEDSGEKTAVSGPAVSVKVGGEIAAEFIGFTHDFSSREKIKKVNLADLVSGALNFSASGANVDAYIGFNLSAASLSEIASGLETPGAAPLLLDEAYLRAFFGPVNIEAGYRKLTWGKADSFGPLDVINPLDYTDLTNISDIQAIKIARPLVHVSWNTGSFSKIEGVFIPNFTGHRFDRKGRWIPAQYTTTTAIVEDEIRGRLMPMMALIPPQNIPVEWNMYLQKMADQFAAFSPDFPDTSGLEYLQAGLRFTTTAGPADIGIQYFYGNLFQPDLTIAGIDDFISDLAEQNMPLFLGNTPINLDDIYPGDINKISPRIKYSRYHQIGLDYAQVLFSLNVRAEFAFCLTEDLKGDDGSVRNPFLGWSLGFDRDLFWGINVNVQCNETVRLFNDRVGDNPVYDCEADTDVTSTRITVQLSRKFFRDELETKATVIWDIENADGYIIPAIVWAIKDVTAELSAGIFTGKESGDLGQYWENSFVKLGLKYSF
jgi:hypothetical protein